MMKYDIRYIYTDETNIAVEDLMISYVTGKTQHKPAIYNNFL